MFPIQGFQGGGLLGLVSGLMVMAQLMQMMQLMQLMGAFANQGQNGNCGCGHNLANLLNGSANGQGAPTPLTGLYNNPHAGTVTGGCGVVPLAQSDGDNCGKASVAMVVNAMTGKGVSDRHWGEAAISLEGTLEKETGRQWGAHKLSADNWGKVVESVQNGDPVILGGKKGLTNGNIGHFVVIDKIEGNTVHICDPAGGTRKTMTVQQVLDAQGYSPKWSGGMGSHFLIAA